MQPIVPRHDPSPSRMRYRFERLWLKKSVRQVVQFWLPVGLGAWVVFATLGNATVQTTMDSGLTGLRDTVAERPQLQVTMLSMPEASVDLQAQIFAVAGISLPSSALDIDVEQIKAAVEKLDSVETATVMMHSDGLLEIHTVERVPTIVWRDGDTLRLIDTDGNRVAVLARRSARGDLPLIVGVGAENNVPEIMSLLAVIGPVEDRLRGFVRVGERRWDVVLDRGQTIMLPEAGAVTALRRVMALHQTEDMLARDIIIVDMRNGARPVLRLTDEAISELRRLRAEVRGTDA